MYIICTYSLAYSFSRQIREKIKYRKILIKKFEFLRRNNNVSSIRPQAVKYKVSHNRLKCPSN